MKENQDLLVIGHTALDYIMKVSEFPKANFSAPITNMKNFYGGAGANVAHVAANLGLDVSLISAVGDNFQKTEYYKQMEELGIDTDSLIIVSGESTPTAFVLTNDKGDQISYFYWGAAKDFQKTETPEKKIKNANAIHLATGDPNFNWKCGKFAKMEEKIVSFDPGQDLGMYDLDILKDVVKNTDILFGNHYEIERILAGLNKDIDSLINIGPRIIVKTCGEEGSVIYTADEKIKIDAVPTDAIDPTGAGDSYRAGFLTRFLNGESIEDSAKFASAVSSFVVSAQGCQTNIPTFDDAYGRMIEFYSE